MEPKIPLYGNKSVSRTHLYTLYLLYWFNGFLTRASMNKSHMSFKPVRVSRKWA